jgi:hypothetical protein
MMLLQAQPYKHHYEYRRKESRLWVIVAPLTDERLYPRVRSNYLAQGSSFGLLMVYFCCVLYKVESLSGSSDVRLIMSPEQVSWKRSSAHP